ncbi:hypothetical protein PR048_023910 [Dryococelus australis]|uniref:Uncharacterized protein n=1 Tax=Dryococelus australis TaxID=614101 RepID=A0ABQ9GVF2_9NEOP|nr:hypothetical protein PR048_023910 [Dryococelus australis]
MSNGEGEGEGNANAMRNIDEGQFPAGRCAELREPPEEIWVALNIGVMRADEGEVKRVWSSAGVLVRGKGEIYVKMRRPAASSGIILNGPAGNRARFALAGGEPSIAEPTAAPFQLVIFFSWRTKKVRTYECIADPDMHVANDCRSRKENIPSAFSSTVFRPVLFRVRAGTPKSAVSLSLETRHIPMDRCNQLELSTNPRHDWTTLQPRLSRREIIGSSQVCLQHFPGTHDQLSERKCRRIASFPAVAARCTAAAIYRCLGRRNSLSLHGFGPSLSKPHCYSVGKPLLWRSAEHTSTHLKRASSRKRSAAATSRTLATGAVCKPTGWVLTLPADDGTRWTSRWGFVRRSRDINQPSATVTFTPQFIVCAVAHKALARNNMPLVAVDLDLGMVDKMVAGINMVPKNKIAAGNKMVGNMSTGNNMAVMTSKVKGHGAGSFILFQYVYFPSTGLQKRGDLSCIVEISSIIDELKDRGQRSPGSRSKGKVTWIQYGRRLTGMTKKVAGAWRLCPVPLCPNSGMKGWGKLNIPEKNRRPAASSGTIPTCENPGVTRPGIESGSSCWEASRLTALKKLKIYELYQH